MTVQVRGQLFPVLMGILEEYVKESEHQGGEEYWNKFVGEDGILYDKLIIDLGLYLAHRGWDKDRDKDLPKAETLDKVLRNWHFRDEEYLV